MRSINSLWEHAKILPAVENLRLMDDSREIRIRKLREDVKMQN